MFVCVSIRPIEMNCLKRRRRSEKSRKKNENPLCAGISNIQIVYAQAVVVFVSLSLSFKMSAMFSTERDHFVDFLKC